jgi:GTP pyrophosphokinase
MTPTLTLKEQSQILWGVFQPKISYLSLESGDLVELAFWQMVEAHNEQKRKSGEYYIIHPVAAAEELVKMQMGGDVIAAALLHDVPEDTEVGLDKIEKIFGQNIAFLVGGITKLSKIRYTGEELYVENLRKMFVAMSKDIRIIFIKLADRLHNLHTLEHVSPEKAKRIALESLEIYAPIANRLGISYFKGEIEDAAFPYVYPEEYKELVAQSKITVETRLHELDEVKNRVADILAQENVKYLELLGRAKKYYSLFLKLKEKKEIDNIFDLVALRIVVPSVGDCYVVLGIIHSHFTPLPNRVKDYIANPKPNGYQSIHTTVIDKSGIVFEVQIRTQEMHEFAEYGIAAHWAYSQAGKNSKQTSQQMGDALVSNEQLKWITELVKLGSEEISQEEYLKTVKLDLFANRIFVLTPRGDVLDLPSGATPLDFAYKIHKDIGNNTQMAKVNGSMVKLNHELKNGDLVEILTNKKQKPSRDWLDWVRTRSARKYIQHMLKSGG